MIKQDEPNEDWCEGCTPDNCPGCVPEDYVAIKLPGQGHVQILNVPTPLHELVQDYKVRTEMGKNIGAVFELHVVQQLVDRINQLEDEPVRINYHD